ncbi:4-hydroxyphenylacetate 3-hydroxylase N-terminal domain-containing protein [Polyangium sp. 6x1]|uniref:4-hydroxyphenylacetate 3-hydroxylase family protein n=1 Tax=Polyangium sp. 6x1 TaxID=3042689 RepID=UPI0024830EAC|nr:4-hydroxyphenylacetate 3-hydroxylase N-terminal domain-containing protein [Polyangium sp. 6x1]MDI1446081.1 4-hydroxyphenylacetate 3-hydroxylase N-terminal domain-containing protein [Polyangium sp. 6x1]
MSASRTNGTASRTRPLTGAEYLESLRDGRDVWIRGERVTDVPNHPFFRNATRMLARLYDALHDPARQETLTAETEMGSGARTHRFFCVPRSVEDLVSARDAIAEWARITYGWMGQSPEEGASLVATLGAAPEVYGRFADHARRWYHKASGQALFFHHAMLDPRVPSPNAAAPTPLHVERETDAGIVVHGTTIVPSAAALSHCSFVVQPGIVREKECFLSFVVPMGSRGVKLQCRPGATMSTKLHGSPFDHPLTSRLEEDEAVLSFDDVLVPWENVFLYRDEAAQAMAFQRASFAARVSFQECTRLSVKLEFLAGLLLRSVEAAGTGGSPEVRAALGEVLSYRNLFWGLTEAQARVPAPWANGACLPNPEHGLSFRIFSTLAYPRLRDVIERAVGNGHVFLSANASDFMNPETRAYLERFVRGENGYTALDRVKLTKLLWDALGGQIDSHFASGDRMESADDMRIDVLSTATTSGLAERCKAFAGHCLDEYDLEGWRTKDLFTPNELVPVVSSRRRPSSW